MSKFDLLYLNEKAEELRSRLSLAYSSVKTLDQIFFNIYNEFVMKDEVPPFIYPGSQIRHLKTELEYLLSCLHEKIGLNETMTSDKEFLYASFVIFAMRLGELLPKCRNVLLSSQALLNVLEQRILDLEILDDLRYSENLQHEFIGLTKVFESVDALTYQLLRNALDWGWMRDKKFAPVTIFGEKDYQINTETFVISVPYHDCFRSRFWATLAHEVAHIFFHYYKEETKNRDFEAYYYRNTYKLLRILLKNKKKRITQDKHISNEKIGHQVVELVCDIVACYICGSPPLLSICTYDNFVLSCVDMKKNHDIEIGQKSHPFLFFRFLVMKKTLEHTGILDVDKRLSEFISPIERITRFDSAFALKRYGKNYLPSLFKDYYDFAEEISDDFLDFLDNLRNIGKIECFGKDEFINLRKSLKEMRLEALTPIETINLVWLKRRFRILKNPDLSTKEFFEMRRDETKIYETMVLQSYNYYENTVYEETKNYTNEEVDICLLE